MNIAINLDEEGAISDILFNGKKSSAVKAVSLKTTEFKMLLTIELAQVVMKEPDYGLFEHGKKGKMCAMLSLNGGADFPVSLRLVVGAPW